MTAPYPLLFEPDFRDKPWGSRRLHDVLGKEVSPERPVGESWEVWSGSVVANGAWAGSSVDQLIGEQWQQIMGRQLANLQPRTFPLLFKFIDANEWLSVQVHPDDSYAQQHEGVYFGKTEAWYIVHADPGAEIIYGWKHALSRDDVARAVREDTIKQDLQFSVVAPGDVVPVPAGTVHALGSGIVLAEIQQNSDVTYRLYDWGRVGLDGKPRQLHIDQSLDTLDYSAASRQFRNADSIPAEGSQRRLALCRYFAMDLLDINGELALNLDGERFIILAALQGSSSIGYAGGEVALPSGTSALLPAALGKTRLRSPSGARLLALSVPRPDELAAMDDAQRVF
jgi:mannose-6-phosphate isomerase